MKIAFPVLGLLAVLGIAYGLAFFGIIPAQKMADRSPGVARTLIALHLAKAKKPAPAGRPNAALAAVLSPEQEALNAEKQQITDAKAALAKDQAEFEAEKQAAPAVPATPAVSVPTTQDSAGKLSAIYAAMSPDDMLTIFAKLPDPDVVRALMNLDEKKAGKVLAGLPPTRAARLTEEMSRPTPPRPAAVASL